MMTKSMKEILIVLSAILAGELTSRHPFPIRFIPHLTIYMYIYIYIYIYIHILCKMKYSLNLSKTKRKFFSVF